MKISRQIYFILFIVISISFGFGGNLYLENQSSSIWKVIYDSSPNEIIAGFQFDVDGNGVAVDSVYGGAAGEMDFLLSANETTVIGFSIEQSTIPTPMVGGTLIILDLLVTEVQIIFKMK